MLYITHIRLSRGDGEQHITRVLWEQPSKDRVGSCACADIIVYIRNGVDVRVRSKGRDIKVVIVDAKPPGLQTAEDSGRTKHLFSLPTF